MKIMILFAILLLSACTSMKHNGAVESRTQINFPPVGAKATKSLGEKLIEKGYITTQKALHVKEAINGALYDIPTKNYKQTGYDDKGMYFEPWGVVQSILADPFTGLTVKHDKPEELCVITIFAATSCYKGFFEIADVESFETPSYTQTLIYTGKVDNKIRFAYREFSNSVARPAFNTEVEYDLNESNIVGYQGAKLKVLDSTNTSITYEVISNF